MIYAFLMFYSFPGIAARRRRVAGEGKEKMGKKKV